MRGIVIGIVIVLVLVTTHGITATTASQERASVQPTLSVATTARQELASTQHDDKRGSAFAERRKDKKQHQ